MSVVAPRRVLLLMNRQCLLSIIISTLTRQNAC
jgi:hypothetical protein